MKSCVTDDGDLARMKMSHVMDHGDLPRIRYSLLLCANIVLAWLPMISNCESPLAIALETLAVATTVAVGRSMFAYWSHLLPYAIPSHKLLVTMHCVILSGVFAGPILGVMIRLLLVSAVQVTVINLHYIYDLNGYALRVMVPDITVEIVHAYNLFDRVNRFAVAALVVPVASFVWIWPHAESCQLSAVVLVSMATTIVRSTDLHEMAVVGLVLLLQSTMIFYAMHIPEDVSMTTCSVFFTQCVSPKRVGGAIAEGLTALCLLVHAISWCQSQTHDLDPKTVVYSVIKRGRTTLIGAASEPGAPPFPEVTLHNTMEPLAAAQGPLSFCMSFYDELTAHQESRLAENPHVYVRVHPIANGGQSVYVRAVISDEFTLDNFLDLAEELGLLRDKHVRLDARLLVPSEHTAQLWERFGVSVSDKDLAVSPFTTLARELHHWKAHEHTFGILGLWNRYGVIQITAHGDLIPGDTTGARFLVAAVQAAGARLKYWEYHWFKPDAAVEDSGNQ